MRTQSKTQRASWILPTLFILSLMSLVYRLQLNVDLGDESYYALFPMCWLRVGVSACPIRDIHASAALLIYPLVRLCLFFELGDEHIVVILRILYGIFSVICALSFVNLFKKLGYQRSSWLAASLILVFIPFGLPAPSYNTLGLQGEALGLAWFGIAILTLERGSNCTLAFCFSACGFTVAALAYPTLLFLVPIAFGASVSVSPRFYLRLFLFAVSTLSLITAGWFIILYFLTLPVVVDIFRAQQHATSFSASSKLLQIIELITKNSNFGVLCFIAFLIGIIRPWLSSTLVGVLTSCLLFLLWYLPSSLFIKSHDVVLLASLIGTGILANLSRTGLLEQRVVAILYFCACCGGLITALTTSNSPLFNFAVGGAPAAIFAVLPWDETSAPRDAPGRRWLIQSGAFVMLALVGWVSFSFRYGDLPTDTGEPRRRLSSGPFAGLSVSVDQAKLIETASAMLNPPDASAQTLAVFGRLPGLYLTSAAKPHALRSFTLDANSSADTVRDIQTFYAARPPDLVAIFEDPYLPVVNPMQPGFADRYLEVSRRQTPTGSITLYRRASDRR